ncbi:MAG: hypothetical protein Q4P06_07950 [Actinomycetaceae bacterium]|nr:hypothetical protein [Actinomycetaceae bacterium]
METSPLTSRPNLILAAVALIAPSLGFVSMIDTGSGIVLLLFVLPVVMVTLGALGGWFRSPWWLIPAAATVGTLVAILIWANLSASIYIAFYLVAVITGYLVGWLGQRTYDATAKD